MNSELSNDGLRVVLLFGVNAVGKSSLGCELAARLPRCSLIEVDELRYKVKGGLVGHSRGLHPEESPADYALQREMASNNAVLLASGFAKYGFSSVIDGLEERYSHQKGWVSERVPSSQVITVGLFCDESVLQKRRALRGWTSVVPNEVKQKLDWYRNNLGGFDLVLDTSFENTERLVSVLEFQKAQQAS